MRLSLLLIILCLGLLALLGCGPEPLKQPTSNELTKGLDQERIRREDASPTTNEAEQQATSTIGSAVHAEPMTSGATGAITPMHDSGSVDGAGGGVGSAAKDQARDAAANVGGTTATTEREVP